MDRQLYGTREPVVSMIREKFKRKAFSRMRVPMRGTGTEPLVVAMKDAKAFGAKGWRHPVGLLGQLYVRKNPVERQSHFVFANGTSTMLFNRLERKGKHLV